MGYSLKGEGHVEKTAPSQVRLNPLSFHCPRLPAPVRPQTPPGLTLTAPDARHSPPHCTGPSPPPAPSGQTPPYPLQRSPRLRPDLTRPSRTVPTVRAVPFPGVRAHPYTLTCSPCSLPGGDLLIKCGPWTWYLWKADLSLSSRSLRPSRGPSKALSTRGTGQGEQTAASGSKAHPKSPGLHRCPYQRPPPRPALTRSPDPTPPPCRCFVATQKSSLTDENCFKLFNKQMSQPVGQPSWSQVRGLEGEEPREGSGHGESEM